MSIKRSRERQPERIAFARDQRKHANDFSHDVWQMVRAGRMLSEKFRREVPVGPYTLDFASIELKLDLEIDGKEHMTEEGMRRDAQRDAYLQKLGFTVLRINGFRVTQDPLSVRNEIEAIVRELREKTSPPRRHQQTPHPRPLSPEYRGEGSQSTTSKAMGMQAMQSRIWNFVVSNTYC